MRDFGRRLFRIRPRNEAATEQELRDEIEAHLELAIEHLLRRGIPPDEAARLARQRFGDLDGATRSLVRSAILRENAVTRREWFAGLGQDLRIALRQLRRSPVFTACVALTLGLGIGANLATFDLVDRVLLSPPPGITDAGRVRRVLAPQVDVFQKTTTPFPVTNYATYMDLQSVSGFAALGAFGFPNDASLGLGREAKSIRVNGASASFFTLLGARPALGRFYSPAEDAPPNGSSVAVLSNGYWQREFAGAQSVLGRVLLIDGKPFTVVGVAAPGFNGVDLTPVDIWLPITTLSLASIGDHYVNDHGSMWLMVVGRLANNADERRVVAEASAAVVRNNPRVASADPHAQIELASVIAGRERVNRQGAAFSIVLLGVTVAVLLIACANVATLLLTRAVQRKREVAIRLAMGVSRLRLFGQLLVEGTILGLLAAGAAVGGALLARAGIRRTVPSGATWEGVSPHLLPAALLLVLLIILFATLTPAVHAMRVDVATALKASSRSVADARLNVRGVLLTLQVALSAMLLVGAGLFLRSLRNAESTRLGIDTDRVILGQVDLTAIGMDQPRKDMFWQSALERVIHLPHVSSASLSVAAPMRFSMSGTFIVPGVDSLPRVRTGGPYRYGVDERFFATIGARIIRGRGFTAADMRGSQRVLVISQTTAKLIWPRGDPIGVCVRTFQTDTIPCATIVGVVEDVHRQQLREDPTYQYYVPYSQWIGPKSAATLVRFDDDIRSADLELVRRTLAGISSKTPFPTVQSYADIVAPQLQSWRVAASMFSFFGVLALLVTVVGLYGLLAYMVSQQRFELGIRAALGATSADLMSLVLRRGVVLVLLGLVLGLGAAAALSGRAAPLLLDVSPHDPVIYLAIAGAALLVTAAATLVPARRAATIDPTEALRAD